MSSKTRGARRDAMGTVFLLASMLAAPPHAAAATGPDARAVSHRPGEILVKLRRGVTEERGRAVLRGHGAQKTDRFRRPRHLRETAIERWWHVELAPGQDAGRVIQRLSKHADVERAELNYELSMHATPSDPLFGQLWGLHNTGQTGGTPDADIDAPEAWDVGTGSSAVVVAVVDTGIDYAHPDLAANIWTNPGEIPGNGVDDDGNGYVDDVHGYDFVNDDGDPFDDHGHGTHVAGTIAATGDNGLGVVGVSWRSRLMALKFLAAGGSGSTDDAIRALLYAADMGAVVINNSWGGGPFSQALLDAVRATDAAGALFVASAGNSNRDIDLFPSYPAAYDVENLLAVAAVDHNDARAVFSNWGAARVHLAAPGVSILSTVPVSGNLGDPSGYRLLNGTSMAAPHVSGAAALLRSHFPTLDGRELKRRLMAGAEPVASMAGLSVTEGRLNVANPLVPDPVPPAGVSDLAVTAAGSRRVELSWTAPGGDGSLGQATRYEVRYSTTPITEATFDAAARAPSAPRPAAAGATEALTVKGLEPATRYYFALKAFDQAGNASVLSNVAAADTRDEVVLYRDAFESGAPDWTVEGSDGNGGPALWHLSTQMAASPTHAFYYGREPQLDYSTGAPNSGSLTSPAISLAGSSQCLLSFQHFLGNESREPYDRARVLVSSDDGVTWTPLWTRYLRTGSVFEQVLVDLSSYDGQVIRLRFEFDTIDQRVNWYRGWVVDDVVVLAAVAAGGNQPPIADAGGPYTGRRHLDVTFDGSGSTDPEGDPISYRWDFGDGAVAFGPNPTHAYQTTGTFDVRLVVNDGARSSASSTTVTVTAPSPELVLHVTTDENGRGGVRVDPPNEVCDNQAPFSSRDCYHYFEPGTVVTLTPVADSTSLRWSGACSGTGPCQISMTGDKEVWAHFEGPKRVSISLHSVDQGAGTVRMQAPDGTFDCSVTAGSVNNCSYLYPVGTVVTFTATAGPTSYFQGWQYTESCSGTGPCQVTVGLGASAHAYFLGPRPLTVDVGSALGGVGTVHVVDPPTGSCAGLAHSQTQCQFLMKPGAAVTLAAAAEPGSRFLGWGGACGGLGTCQVTMPITATAGPSLSARFQLNRPPMASAGGPYGGVRQREITFNGSASTDPDGDALTYEWAFGDGATATGVTPTHAYAALGTFVVTLTVRDGFGGSSSSSTTATISNQPPAASPGGPYGAAHRQTITFDGSASSDPDGDALTYEWTFGDGATATGVSPAHAYAAPGSYTVALTVRDGFGGVSSSSTTATIVNRAPTANPGGPYAGVRRRSVTFSGAASTDPDGDALTYEWTFGDGGAATGISPTHTYSSAGTYTVTLRVRDAFGATASASTTATIMQR